MSLFNTWTEFENATPEEWHLERMLWFRAWQDNYDDQIAEEIIHDHHPEREPWTDEYTSIGDDAARIRQAGKLTAVRNTHAKATKG